MKKLFIALFALALSLTGMAQVTKTVNSYSSGTLAIQIGSELANITELTITGYIDARDFVVMRDAMPQIEKIDLSGATIQSYSGSEGPNPWGYYSYPENEIPQYAFNNPNGNNNRNNFKKVITPNTTTKIGENAFSGNYSLTNITLNSGLTSIGYSAFTSCHQISSISIPNTVNAIGDNAFNSCDALTGEITLPSSLSEFGTSVFQGCTKITGFVINSSNQKYSTENGVMFNKDKTTLLQYPIDKEGSYTIPNSVTKIAQSAFYGCTKLTGILTLPNAISTVENNAFNGCTGLSGALTLGSGLQTIGENAFFNCSGITDFAIAATNANFEVVGGVLFNKAKTNLLLYPPGKAGSYTIPSTVTSIAKNAFNYCTKLSGDLRIPNAVTSIADYAFQSCTGLNGTLTLGTGLTSIGHASFYHCNGIKVINCLRTTPPTTSSWAFYFSKHPIVYTPSAAAATAYKAATGWSNFPTILSPGFSIAPNSISGLNYAPGATTSDAKYFTISGGFLTGNISINAPTNFEISTNGGISFSPQTSITLPQIGGMVAIDTIYVRMKTGLVANTYTGNISISSTGITTQTIALTGIVRTMPELMNVTDAGTLSSLFSLSEKLAITKLKVTGRIDARDIKCMRDEMPLLADLDLSEANIVAYNGNEVTGWHSEYLANEMPRNSFLNTNTTLTSIKLPNTVTSIGTSAFYGCSKITSLTLGSGLLTIGEHSFNNCSGLKSITFGNNITSVGNYAFSNCSALEGNLIIPNSVTSIGTGAFSSCSKITSLTLGSGLLTIGEGAFVNCTNLKIISSLNETPPSLGNYVFGWDYKQKVYVPSKSSVENYKSDSKWTNFTINPSGIDVSAVSIAGLNYVPNSSNPDAKMFTVSGGILQGDILINAPTNFEISTNPSPAFSGQNSVTLNQTYGVVNMDTIYVRLKTGLGINSYAGNLTIASTGYSNISIPLTGIVRNIPDTISLLTAGKLSESLSATEKSSITKLKLKGNIDARDFKCLRDELTALSDLDLSEANIVEYTGLEGTYSSYSYSYTYTAKTLPQNAFSNKKILKSIILPTLIDGIAGNAFENCGLKLFTTKPTAPSGSLSGMALTNSIVYVPTGKADIYKTAWGTGTNVIIIDKDIEVTVNVTEAGKLATTIYNQTSIHPSLFNKLTVTGILGASDITYIRDNMKQCYDVNLEGVNLTALPADAFNGRSFLFAVKLPTNLKTIGTGAFLNCSNLSVIDIPTSLTTIGSRAFYNCSSLKILDAPSSVNSIGNQAFYGCANLTDVTFNGDVIINNEGNSNTSGTFYGCNNLRNLTFKGVANISGTYSGYLGAFHNCIKLSTVTFNSTSSIGTNAFKNCNGLIYLQIDKASNIGEAAFSGCTGLKTATINGATIIGNSSFSGCSGLTAATINGATSIGSSAFNGCTSLTTFDIPSSVISIGDAAFQNCSKMDSVSIGAKVSTIGANAFAGCNKLSKISVYRLTPAALGLNVFSGVNTQTCKLRILEEADFDAYFSAAQWGSFLTVERINLSGLLGDSNEDGAINIVDVVNIVNYILEKPVTKFNLLYSDINRDGNINVIDVVQLVKQITNAPSGAPAMRANALQHTTGLYYSGNGVFKAFFPTGLRGFDIEYSGNVKASPALAEFNVLPYTKNGKQRLLGYSTNNALTTTEMIALFELSADATIADMTFVSDNGSLISMVPSATTDVNIAKDKDLFVVENGLIRATNAVLAMQLYTLNGSLVAHTTNAVMPISQKLKGIYVLKMNTLQGLVTQKITLF